MEHHFNTDIAKDYGIEEAIILHSIFFWLSKNASNNKHFYDGLYWFYNSKKAFVEMFPYMNETKIFRLLKNLEEKDIIAKGNYSKDKWDKTNWYALTKNGIDYMVRNGYKNNDLQSLLQNDTIERVKMNDGACQNERCINNYYTDIDTNRNKEEDTNVSPKKIDYQAVFDCWNKYNGEKIRKVTQFTDARKKAIKKMLDIHNISQEVLMRFFASLPFADQWLFHPTGTHKLWKPTLDWWMTNTKGWLTKGLEGGVHLENPQAFERIMKDGTFSSQSVMYLPQGRTIWFNEETKSYWSDDNFYYESISDGYEDDNRPDGATLTLNNARGNITWNTQTKKWEKV